jgi:excisionase family DNA binding protein
MPEPLALTLDAAAEALSVSPRTVRRLLDAGELGRVKIGRAVRVHAGSLRAYVERQFVGVDEHDTAGATLIETQSRSRPGACRDANRKTPTGSTGVVIRRTGGRATPTPEAAALAALLARPIAPKPKRS